MYIICEYFTETKTCLCSYSGIVRAHENRCYFPQIVYNTSFMLLSISAVNHCSIDRSSLAGELFQLHITHKMHNIYLLDITEQVPKVYKFRRVRRSRTSTQQRPRWLQLGASPDQTKWGWHIGEVWGGCPLPSRGRVWEYNLKLISTLHNDSIPETPWGKRKVGWTCPPQSTPWTYNAPSRSTITIPVNIPIPRPTLLIIPNGIRGSTQPFCHNTLSGPIDRQTDGLGDRPVPWALRSLCW